MISALAEHRLSGLGPRAPLSQHEVIVAAVTARDAAGAERAMHSHLQSVIDALQALPAARARR